MWKDRSWAEAALAWFRGFRVGARSPGPGLTAGEQSASCAPGNPVETVKAKVKPKVPPAPAFFGAGIESALLCAHAPGPSAQRDWDSGRQDF